MDESKILEDGKKVDYVSVCKLLEIHSIADWVMMHIDHLSQIVTNLPDLQQTFLSMGILTPEEITICTSQSTDHERIQAYLTILVQRNESKVIAFALYESGNHHILKFLRNHLEKKESERKAAVKAATVANLPHFKISQTQSVPSNLSRDMIYETIRMPLPPLKFTAGKEQVNPIFSHTLSPVPNCTTPSESRNVGWNVDLQNPDVAGWSPRITGERTPSPVNGYSNSRPNSPFFLTQNSPVLPYPPQNPYP